MPRHRLSLAPWVVTAMLLLAGCNGAGDQEAPGTGPPPPTTEGPAPAGDQADQKPVTPVRRVDPKQLVDVVEAEIQGGEAEEPSPESVLWLPADETLIQDEPYTVAVPLGLPTLIQNVQVPEANPMTKGKVELGRLLYFDPRVSKDGTISCATCHNPEKGWTDQRPSSVGIGGQVGSRSAPTVLNTVYGKTMFWDGRAPSLEGQAQGPIQNKIEMGDQSYEEIVNRLRDIPDYQDRFRKVFGTEVTIDGLAKAIAAFERTVLSGNSAYDRYQGGPTQDPDMSALTESQKRGMVLFGLELSDEDEFRTDVVKKKANCTSCHVGFNFTDELFHNLGVGWLDQENKFAANDTGRFAIAPIGAKSPKEIGAYKTPTLRDIANTGPYMHDGSEKTLAEVIAYYDRGGNANPHLDPDMKKLNLTEQEQKDLVSFMEALTGDPVKVDLPTLPPDKNGQSGPDPRSALEPPPVHEAEPTASTGGDLHGLLLAR